MSSTFAIQEIAIERKRMSQVSEWDDEWEDQQRVQQLLHAASCYLREPRNRPSIRYKPPVDWPFRKDVWDPLVSATRPDTDARIVELVRAAAFISAEVDRLNRIRNSSQ